MENELLEERAARGAPGAEKLGNDQENARLAALSEMSGSGKPVDWLAARSHHSAAVLCHARGESLLGASR